MTKPENNGLAAEKPTVKILLYTDNPAIAPTNEPGELFGLGSMLDRLQAHAPTFAKIETIWVSRNSDAEHPADNKLDTILQNETFDEIWFFGMHQSNTERFSLDERLGGPDSELDQNEIEALKEWMSVRADGSGGGGVLMTGDHSNERPDGLVPGKNNVCQDTSAGAAFLGLGRALGRCVPRAGSLRKWEGPPSYHPADSFSTIANSGFQLDAQPQQLQLQPVDADGNPDPNGQPHPLFFYKQGQFVQFFPDHAHEGAVAIPDSFDADVWSGQTRPHVVALGRDVRRPEPLNIIATYNGDLAGVGRIVADSTWHHYMNLNLTSFPHPAPDGSPSDQIGQFYGNLAIWLAPQDKRNQMGRAMLRQLARYTLLLEPELDEESTGATANSVMAQVASPCENNEFWNFFIRRQVIDLYGAQEDRGDLPSKNLILGSILKSYQGEIRAAATPRSQAPTFSVEDMIKAGSKKALEQHVNQLLKTLDVLSSKVKPR